MSPEAVTPDVVRPDGGAPSAAGPVISPAPDDEEAAAIAAALSLLIAQGPPAEPGPEPEHRWRFSGRWWNRPVPHARQRPWRY